MKDNRRDSFTSADNLPMKLLTNKNIVSMIQDSKIIPPYHAQIVPTNKCNMTCSFCSCDNEDRNLQWSEEDAKEIPKLLRAQGTEAVTITGGGEPLLYKHLDELVNNLEGGNIQMGLVTNGKLLHKANYQTLDKLTWCRISNGDERDMGLDYWNKLTGVVQSSPKVDWAFSHVVSKNPNMGEIEKIVTFANLYKMTHVRLVADLFEPGKVDLESVKGYLKNKMVDDSKVIYQGRKNPTKGGDCYIGYLKPLIGADKKVYACCGVQYALIPPSRKMPESLSLGNVEDLHQITRDSSKPFNGHQCDKCYYMSYNNTLGALLGDLKHKRFL